MRGTRSLANIYERYNVALVKPVTYEEATKSLNWRATMEEPKMIHKNETWQLVDKPINWSEI